MYFFIKAFANSVAASFTNPFDFNASGWNRNEVGKMVWTAARLLGLSQTAGQLALDAQNIFTDVQQKINRAMQIRSANGSKMVIKSMIMDFFSHIDTGDMEVNIKKSL